MTVWDLNAQDNKRYLEFFARGFQLSQEVMQQFRLDMLEVAGNYKLYYDLRVELKPDSTAILVKDNEGVEYGYYDEDGVYRKLATTSDQLKVSIMRAHTDITLAYTPYYMEDRISISSSFYTKVRNAGGVSDGDFDLAITPVDLVLYRDGEVIGRFAENGSFKFSPNLSIEERNKVYPDLWKTTVEHWQERITLSQKAFAKLLMDKDTPSRQIGDFDFLLKRPLCIQVKHKNSVIGEFKRGFVASEGVAIAEQTLNGLREVVQQLEQQCV